MPLELLQKIFDLVPFLFFWGAYFLALVFFFRRMGKETLFAKRIRVLLWIVLGFRVLYAFALSVAQYFVWAESPSTRIFLESGIERDSPIAPMLERFPFFFGKLGYFLFYSYGRFWLNVCIAFACVFAFLWFLHALKKWKERFFEDGEIELGALSVALVGWPAFVLFLPIAFLSVVAVSVFRLIFMKEKLTTLGVPFLLAVIILLLYGGRLITLTGVSVLKI